MSRIFVNNLPKHITEDRLREFFSQKGEVTDAKLIRTATGKSRQFAFIGYRTDEEAQGAIKYFDKSFLDTSKISCDVARDDGDPNIPRTWSRHTKQKEEKPTDESNNISDATVKKSKKNVAKINDSANPELQEFFQVMQPRGKSKLWANDAVTCTVNNIGKDEEGSRHSEEKNQEKTINGLRKDKSAKKEDSVNEERQLKAPNAPQHEVISDMDYFRSKIKKDWSDPEDESGDDDGNGIGLEQDDEDNDDEEVSCGSDDSDATEGNRKKKGIKEHSETPMGKEQLLTLPEKSVSEDCNGEFMNSENITTNSPGENEVPLTSRLFVRNLPYVATEDELSELFRKFGNVLEVHLVIDKETKRSKGFAYVRYKDPKEAARALEELDHSIFQGRILHIMPAKGKESSQSQDSVISENKPKTLKRQREEEKKLSEADGNTRAWNSLFMRSDTIVENMARKYKISKSEVLDREADDLAVRLALGETQIIAKTKEALMNAGVNVTALEEFASAKTETLERSNHVLLVKNLSYSSTESELSKMFARFGSVDKIILPPTRTLALVIFLEPAEARAAFRGLAYKRYIDAPLYLEWAPSNILSQDLASNGDSKKNMVVGEDKAKKVLLEHQVLEMSDDEIDPDRVESRSLYVKNLNFKSTGESLRKHISENMKEGKIRSVKIQQHVKKGKNVSTGFGFIEFDSVETAAHVCQDLQGTTFDGHALIFEICHAKKSEVSNKADNDRSSTKIIVRNVAFEATEKELRQLFSPFGQVKSLRLPMRYGKHRGFAFVEFVTKQEAQNALKALSSTHLYGRHLVLERAKEGETLEELRARTAAQFTNDEDGLENPAKLSKKRKFSTPF
ncbi:multiple RNA-binding domain-containing protein 1-like [Silene latifolia]|uniref:multiple RNA-binding domain-containing protein 1-like n=1 Tax=Silene latifolia TaxID=37657 RepID=UPI003D77FB5B